ncbi:hypothetical protein GJQ57_09605 [Ralstonia pickettii]|uniref:Transmembrane protein n=1 Tax=Ralstonia pickettii TaxID=329 RepID=A0A7X2HLS5_RALPI|nr:hypothetical protein [Ralstonia pickettii]MRS98904.1 hypothetical protein [Ralstonia pickettii]
MRLSLEKADFILRVLTFVALVAGGGWAIYKYELSGATDWTNNIALDTKVLPYRDDLRLLVTHVRSKNPSSYEFVLNSKAGDSFELRFRRITMGKNENAVIDEDEGELIAKVDLLKDTGGEYQLLPSAEMDDMRTIVVPVGATISITADMQIHNGSAKWRGKPDTDFISASTLVRVAP